jgi:peptide/nickel transport system substrate-binding protein
MLAACGGSSSATNASSPTGSGAATSGGTLKIVGSGDVDHLDPASAYYTATYTLERAFTRQLVSYPASNDITTASTVAADLATEVPSTSNGGISADGKTYTFHLRPDAMWNTSPPRAVTSQDVARGLQRICNPASPAGAVGYYQNTIEGMKAFCAGFAKVDAASPSAMAAYMAKNPIAGVATPDATTVVITLTQPANDFLNIMALPFASAAPVEYLAYVPDGAQFRSHTLSDGPYQITSYQAGRSIQLDKNPAWTQASDPIRHQYVNAISVTEGQSSDQAVQQQLQAGTADLSWDLPVPTADIPALTAAKDPNFAVFPSASTNPYLVFNLISPNNGGALSKVAVRQALEYAVDKTALGQIYGGPTLNTPLDQVIPPGQGGYQQFDLYPTPDHKGDPAKCKSMLAAAGYPNGLTLTDVARNSGNHPAVAQSIQADFKACGVTTKIVPVSQGDYYGKYLNSPSATKAGTWDISEPGWIADWYGNNGRSFIAVLFDGRTYGPNTVDYGDYNSPAVNALIDQALAAPTADAAAALWHEADMAIMKDAAFIPFQTQKVPVYHSTRVKNATWSPFSQSYDVTNLWLSPTS